MNYTLILSTGIALSVLLFYIVKNQSKKSKRLSINKRIREKIRNQNSKIIDTIYLTPNEELVFSNHFFSQKRVVITGDFIKFNTRNEVAKLLWESGAIIETNFNINTDFLIVGKSHIDSSKVNSAFYLNTTIISENDLLNYYPDLKPQSNILIEEVYLN